MELFSVDRAITLCNKFFTQNLRHGYKIPMQFQTPRLEYGQHKGRSISEVPESYLKWMAWHYPGKEWRARAHEEIKRRKSKA